MLLNHFSKNGTGIRADRINVPGTRESMGLKIRVSRDTSSEYKETLS